MSSQFTAPESDGDPTSYIIRRDGWVVTDDLDEDNALKMSDAQKSKWSKYLNHIHRFERSNLRDLKSIKGNVKGLEREMPRIDPAKQERHKESIEKALSHITDIKTLISGLESTQQVKSQKDSEARVDQAFKLKTNTDDIFTLATKVDYDDTYLQDRVSHLWTNVNCFWHGETRRHAAATALKDVLNGATHTEVKDDQQDLLGESHTQSDSWQTDAGKLESGKREIRGRGEEEWEEAIRRTGTGKSWLYWKVLLLCGAWTPLTAVVTATANGSPVVVRDEKSTGRFWLQGDDATGVRVEEVWAILEEKDRTCGVYRIDRFSKELPI
nr:hypothetical protein L204_05028 [Cryptococcus depauperatus CBS 7855]